jgi:hypothetical protein
MQPDEIVYSGWNRVLIMIDSIFSRNPIEITVNNEPGADD